MTDYDAMTEREAMQLRVLRVAYHLEDGLGPNGLLGPYSGDEEQLVRGLLDDLHAVSDWLDAQPAAPERWEPVTKNEPPIPCDCEECDRVLYIDDYDALTIEDGDSGDIQSIQLPVGYALFRRMEVTE